ncbi:hypothetical protein [Roseisolibacter agri]|uniref:Lipoprotein n=1 Tax=Roseisolibacter agri TaxID=2014610 RepID=A0AA37Q9B5_9BACT|nr:hypothetical protein [Roseisolibacter agri]GLC24681.1 hypothetical protein rosag_11940 [Roseisolibacter agri]
MTRRALRIAVLAGLLAPVLVGGCRTWKSRAGAPRDAVASAYGRTLRVTFVRRDDPGALDTLVLRDARVDGDSIVGSSGWTGDAAQRRRAIALADVREVASPRVHPMRTAALVVGPLALVASAVAAFVVWTPISY